MAKASTLIEVLGVPKTMMVVFGVFILIEVAAIWFIFKALTSTIKWIFGI